MSLKKTSLDLKKIKKIIDIYALFQELLSEHIFLITVLLDTLLLLMNTISQTYRTANIST